MTTFKKQGTVLAILLLFGAAGCADLEVRNLNEPDRGQALASPGDVESLIAGGFQQIYSAGESAGGAGHFLSIQAFQHSASWANFCMVPCSPLPRQALQNDPVSANYGNLAFGWTQAYRGLAVARDGLRTLEDPDFVAQFSEEDLLRVRAFAKFVQGVGHGFIGGLYDQGFIIDETVEDIDNLGDPVPYGQMVDAALGYLDEAIQIADGADFSIPDRWINGNGSNVSAEEFITRAYAYKAIFRAKAARTPEERSGAGGDYPVDWDAVLDDLENAEPVMFAFDFSTWFSDVVFRQTLPGWSWLTYMVMGMADQSGNVQAWWDTPVGDREAIIDDEPVLIVTPDTRFPQGSTVEEQIANPGTHVEVSTTTWHSSIDEVWAQPARGTWRWSWYRHRDNEQYWLTGGGSYGMIGEDELRLLEAEAHYWNGDRDLTADLVNVTRTAAGLNATDEEGTNTDCVPRLPGDGELGECGGLLEMLKWEKRLHTRSYGPWGASWYVDGRGWGDLYRGTQLSLPMPCLERDLLGEPCYNVGGGERYSAPTSVYAWPHEG